MRERQTEGTAADARPADDERSVAGSTRRGAGSGTARDGDADGNPSAAPPPIIELDGIGKVFYTEEVKTHALADVHLEIDEGEFVSVAGPSGCGKSTLLSLLGLLDVPTSGEYRLDGTPASGLSGKQRARVRNHQLGFVFQTFNLIGDLTVFENVELPLTYRDDLSPAEREERAEAALEQVGMGHRLQHVPSQLSGGQQQRVAVARAVVGDPLIILADEPTGNLDSVNSEQVMELLAGLHDEGATICMVTHDPRDARYAERRLHLFDGRIVEDERSEEALEELEASGFEVVR